MKGWIDHWALALRALPLRRRLLWLIGTTAGITALLCLFAVLGSGLWLQRDRARAEAHEVARMLAFALEAPLAFGDRRGIDDALAQMRARPAVNGAWVWGLDGKLAGGFGARRAEAPGAPLVAHGLERLVVTEPVRSGDQLLGRVVVDIDQRGLRVSMFTTGLAVVLASLTALLVSLLLARRIAQAITRPIETLAEATREIARSHDYARRLPDAGRDEIGTATAAFNDMLDEIRKRGDTLVEANRQLEVRVADRTLLLQHEKERAEAASRAKTRFLANMSHELRTPLNAVIGAAQLLEDRRADPSGQERLVAAIRDSGVALLGLIDNVLDLARIESGALEIVPEDFHLVDCVEAAVATASVGARLKGLDFACVVDPRLEGWRHGDPMRLRQVLLNLLGNAVKFTQAGEVVLRVAPGPAPNAVAITVTDTGIGIGQASLDQVFEPFKQADDGTNRRYGGSGLGLAISRQLVELMGGTIRVASTLGQGTRFDLVLALPPAAGPRAEPVPLGHDVLFFEPHPASAEALAAQLQRLGCRARHCSTPRELRQWLARFDGAPVQPWLLAAVDADETWGFLEESISWLDPRRVVGMAVSESPASQAMRHRFRVPQALVKPVLRDALRACLDTSTPVATLPAVLPPARPAPGKGARAKHVLVVEDDPTNQLIVCGMLTHAGFRTSVASDGAQAIELLARRSVDVVLMDCQMPGMDGLEVTRRLRAGVAGRFAEVVPIVALTANAFSEDRNACLEAGMNDFLTKPVLARALVAAVERWTQRPGGDEDAVRGSAFAPLA